MVRFWSDKSELQAHFAASLAQSVNLNPRRGWIRAPAAADPDVAQSIAALAESVDDLRQTTNAQPNVTPEIDFSANRLLDILSEKTWQVGDGEIAGLTLFVLIAEALGGEQELDQSIANRLLFNSNDVRRFLNSLDLLGAVEREGSHFRLSNIGRQMYRRFMVGSS